MVAEVECLARMRGIGEVFALTLAPEFFNAVVRPYLKNKKDKTFMDRYLLARTRDLAASVRELLGELDVQLVPGITAMPHSCIWNGVSIGNGDASCNRRHRQGSIRSNATFRASAFRASWRSAGRNDTGVLRIVISSRAPVAPNG